MSNSLTSSFHAILAYELSHNAESIEESSLAWWFCCRDIVLFGNSAVGFDISEIPWSMNKIDSQKEFIQNACDNLLNPPENDIFKDFVNYEMLSNTFQTFYSMIGFVDKNTKFKANLWDRFPENHKLDKCKDHLVYLHWDGCIVCNFLKQFE